MNISKNINIHLTENDVKQIIAEYIKNQKGYSATADNVTFRVEEEYMGYGLGEYNATVFKGCDVNMKEEI